MFELQLFTTFYFKFAERNVLPRTNSKWIGWMIVMCILIFWQVAHNASDQKIPLRLLMFLLNSALPKNVGGRMNRCCCASSKIYKLCWVLWCILLLFLSYYIGCDHFKFKSFELFKWPRDDGRRGLKRLKTPNPGTIFVAAALRHNLLVGINFILIANFRREELLLR